MVRSLAEILVIALFLLTFIVQPFRIPSASMQPTLKVGDFLLVDKQAFAPEDALGNRVLPSTAVRRGDLAVFLFPVDPTRHLVKRVIGLPGDRIHLRDGRVFVNGALLPEPYAFYAPSGTNVFRDDFPDLRDADPDVEERWWLTLRNLAVAQEVTVPPGAYFVLGDNRNNSEDSRYWGFVPRANLVGRPLLVYFSASWPADADSEGAVDRRSWLQRLGGVVRDGLRAARVVR
jgi:signal peptidase I